MNSRASVEAERPPERLDQPGRLGVEPDEERQIPKLQGRSRQEALLLDPEHAQANHFPDSNTSSVRFSISFACRWK